MKNILVTLSAALIALSMSACDEFSSPENVIGTCAQAIQNNDYKTFLETLTGDALAQYGTRAGMGSLKTEFSPYNLRTENTQTLWENGYAKDDPSCTFLCATDFEYNYSVDLMGQEISAPKSEFRRIKEATVFCKVFVTLRDDGGGPRTDRPETIREEICQISSLK